MKMTHGMNRYYSLFFFVFMIPFFVFANESTAPVLAESNVAAAAQPDTSIVAEQSRTSDATDDFDLFNQAFGSNPEDLSNLIQDLFNQQNVDRLKEEIDARSKNFELLTEDIRQKLNEVTDAYHHVGEVIRLEYVFKTLSESIKQELVKQEAQFGGHRAIEYNKLKTALDALLKTLNDGSFSKLAMPAQLSTNPFDFKNLLKKQFDFGGQEQAPAQDAHTFLANVSILLSLLDWYDHCIDDLSWDAGQDGQAAKDFLHLQVSNISKLLRLVLARDGKSLCNECIAMVRPLIDSVVKQIRQMLTILTDARMHLAPDADITLKGAYEFWIKQYKVYYQTLKSFIDLSQQAHIDCSIAIRYLSYIHEISYAFLAAQNSEAKAVTDNGLVKRYANTAFLIDSAMRGAMLALGYTHFSGENANIEVQKYILGQGSLAEFINPLNDEQHRIYSLLTILPIVLNPSAFASSSMNPVVRAAGRVLFAVALMHYGIGNAQEDNNNTNSWHPANQFIRIAFAAIVNEAQSYVSGYLQGKIRANVDPLTLEQVEDASIGLIKPEFVDLALKLIVSTVLMEPGERVGCIAKFDAQDFLRYDFDFLISINKNLGNKEKQQLYIKYLLAHYLCQNMGEFWGKAIAETFKKQLGDALVWVLKNMWELLSDVEDTPADKDMLGLLMIGGGQKDTMNMSDLKDIIKGLFQVQNPMRGFMIGFLKSYGLLDMSITDNDPLEINYRIIGIILYYLTQMHVLTHSKAAQLLQLFASKYEDNIGPFIDLIFDSIAERATTAMGGFLGKITGSFVADKIVGIHKPFFIF